jgi:hypothetical protein
MNPERYYRVKELAAEWGFSTNTIRKLVKDEPGVFKLDGMSAGSGKRAYATYSIPESVATRIRERMSNQPFKTKLPRRDPRRVVFLRDRNRRVA